MECKRHVEYFELAMFRKQYIIILLISLPHLYIHKHKTYRADYNCGNPKGGIAQLIRKELLPVLGEAVELSTVQITTIEI